MSHVYFPDNSLRAIAKAVFRNAAFEPAVREQGQLVRGRWVLTVEQFRSLLAGLAIEPPPFLARAMAPVPTAGPGVELKKLLTKIGITATPNCSCNARARRMDEEEAREPGWCEAHLDEIVGWLREEATKRGLPFMDVAGRVLVRRAIANAKRSAG